MTYAQIIAELDKKIYQPIYFLMGEEPYYIDKIADHVAQNVLSPADQSFNQTVVYGKDLATDVIVTTCKRFPMMASHQVVIVKEAQDLRDIDKLSFYVEKPLASTVLVVCYKYKSLDKRTRLYKLLQKSGILFESKKLYENQVPKWIEGYLAEKGLQADMKSMVMLTEFLGNDLAKIANELDKLAITMPPGQTLISPELIERNIGISKDFNTFELNSALANHDLLKANRIAKYFGDNEREHPLPLTIATLFGFFSKVLVFHYLPNNREDKAVASALRVSPFFVKEYRVAARNYPKAKAVEVISILREYDLKSKGLGNTSATTADLLREMVFKIMH